MYYYIISDFKGKIMIFKDYFSSDAWFDSLKGHLMNIAFTDLNEKWAKPYVAKEVILFNWDAFAGAVVYCISNIIGGFGWIWNQTGGRVFNSADNHNDKNIALDKTETKDDIKTQPAQDSPVVSHETILTEPNEFNALKLNDLNDEILDQEVSLIGASGANVAMMI